MYRLKTTIYQKRTTCKHMTSEPRTDDILSLRIIFWALNLSTGMSTFLSTDSFTGTDHKSHNIKQRKDNCDKRKNSHFSF